MATHKQSHLFEAKSADARISRDQPTVAHVNFSLQNGELLVVEVPRYVLERLSSEQSEPSKQHRFSPADVHLAIRPIPGTNNTSLSSPSQNNRVRVVLHDS